MFLAGVLEQLKLRTELPMKLLGGVTGDRQSTALLGAVWRESRHDDMAAWFD